MERKRTLRMVFPQWQGGVNPDYAFGGALLAHIAPPGQSDETVAIEVEAHVGADLSPVAGVAAGAMLIRQMAEAARVLRDRRPERVVIFGGDCSVTQVPFDYLKSVYGEKLGILWLDAHPDVASPEDSSHLHEMVLANLLGQNPPSALADVAHPFRPNEVLLAGLIEEGLREKDMACKRLSLRIAASEELRADSRVVLDWIAESGIEYLAVHWDLDVLSPADFRSILPAMPHFDPNRFPAAVGRMTLDEVGRVLRDASERAEIVGLSIAEHMPWDAMNLRRTLSAIPIFGDHLGATH